MRKTWLKVALAAWSVGLLPLNSAHAFPGGGGGGSVCICGYNPQVFCNASDYQWYQYSDCFLSNTGQYCGSVNAPMYRNCSDSPYSVEEEAKERSGDAELSEADAGTAESAPPQVQTSPASE